MGNRSPQNAGGKQLIIQYLLVFKEYLIEILPVLAIGFLLSGLIHEFVPSGWTERHLGGPIAFWDRSSPYSNALP
jgi:uncharacterized membrane protein YraQ (UPF0718 family)